MYIYIILLCIHYTYLYTTTRFFSDIIYYCKSLKTSRRRIDCTRLQLLIFGILKYFLLYYNIICICGVHVCRDGSNVVRTSSCTPTSKRRPYILQLIDFNVMACIGILLSIVSKSIFAFSFFVHSAAAV